MASFGATRVTDTTRLDEIGIPVFAAIRPRAGEGSVSVTSGKSLDPLAARVGALAEAFELASAAFVPGQSVLHHLRFDEFSKRCGYSPWAFPIKASMLHAVRPCPPADLMTYVECDFLGSEGAGLIPAVLVYFPYHAALGLDLYGMSTNGLASGNSVEEAALHALLEVVERDVISFAAIGRETRPVAEIELEGASEIARAIREANLQLDVTYIPNEFGFPTFSAYISDPHDLDRPIFVGHGTHLSKDIALLRACTEAVQSRLTHIHGARDDVLEYYGRWSSLDAAGKRKVTTGIKCRIQSGVPITYAAIMEDGVPCTIAEGLRLTLARLESKGIRRVCIFTYPALVNGLVAVRVVVPGLEFYAMDRFRVGERLLAYANSRA